MPTYEYICDKCGHQFEVIQPISAKPLTVCPQDSCGCKSWGKGRIKRAISGGAGLLFKGSGFYITDYRSESYKQAAKKESAPAPDAKSASSPEAKPAKAATGASTAAPAAKT